MVTNRRLLIAIVIVAVLGLGVRFGLTGVVLYNEVYYESAPDELPSFLAVEKYVCPLCEQQVRDAYANQHDPDYPKPPDETRLFYDASTESGFCELHPDTLLQSTRDLPVAPQVMLGLPPQTEYINREYRLKGDVHGQRDTIQMTVVISQRDRRSIHRPESCLYSQGWSQMVPPTDVSIPCPAVAGGEIRVRQILMEKVFPLKNGDKAKLGLVVNAWYAAPPDRLTPIETSYLYRMFYDRLVKGINYRWSSVLIVSRVLPQESLEEVNVRVKQFSQEFSQWAEEQRAGSPRAAE